MMIVFWVTMYILLGWITAFVWYTLVVEHGALDEGKKLIVLSGMFFVFWPLIWVVDGLWLLLWGANKLLQWTLRKVDTLIRP